jgi:hypothetical protein
VYFRGERLAKASGHSIQQAEMNAAKEALELSQGTCVLCEESYASYDISCSYTQLPHFEGMHGVIIKLLE